MKRLIKSTLAAWLLFVGIDFFFHASLLQPLWMEPVAGIKPKEELARLIPAGYLSFLLLTFLIAWLYKERFAQQPGRMQAFRFAMVFAALFSVSNFLAVYSFVAIPIKHLLVFNAVYFIEIMAVFDVLYRTLHSAKPGKIYWLVVAAFIGLVAAGILLQNVM